MFIYFGSKHGAARLYPPPRYPVVVEPFAGAASYSCFWARQRAVNRAILIDTNPALIDLWRRLRRDPGQFLRVRPRLGQRTLNPILVNGGEQLFGVLAGRHRRVTTRMVEDWPHNKNRVLATRPFIRRWKFRCDDYRNSPDIEATWFIDPPYQRQPGTGGKNTAGGHRYHRFMLEGGRSELAKWCRSRRGQVIVCEQSPANWLPFRVFRRQRNAVGRGTYSVRTEVMWTNDDD